MEGWLFNNAVNNEDYLASIDSMDEVISKEAVTD
jgi:hypothetical protein